MQACSKVVIQVYNCISNGIPRPKVVDNNEWQRGKGGFVHNINVDLSLKAGKSGVIHTAGISSESACKHRLLARASNACAFKVTTTGGRVFTSGPLHPMPTYAPFYRPQDSMERCHPKTSYSVKEIKESI